MYSSWLLPLYVGLRLFGHLRRIFVQCDLDLAILDIFYDNKSKFKLTGCFGIDDAHHLEGDQRKGMHLVTPHFQPRSLLT